MTWQVGPTAGKVSTKPVVTVRQGILSLKAIRSGGTHRHFFYEESDSHSIAPGNLHGWGIGGKIIDAEWTESTLERHRACFTRLQPITFIVTLKIGNPAQFTTNTDLRLWVLPTIDGFSGFITGSSQVFTVIPGSTETRVTITTGGRLPDEVARYVLRCQWRVTSPDGTKRYVLDVIATRQYIYAVYGAPKEPEYDSATLTDTGLYTTADKGTLTGTKKRFDFLMNIIGGKNRRCRIASETDIINMIWRLHCGINNTPGAPPWFDAGHDRHMTHNGDGSGTDIPVSDQWLGWLNTPVLAGPGGISLAPEDQHWNDLSCIGHVQLLKTMLASIGFFARRTWVYPHTLRMPDGTTVSAIDSDFFALGEDDPNKERRWTITYSGVSYTAKCVLIEPDGGWENFEACTLSPNNKFLPGGYGTGNLPTPTRTNKGFNSAAELIRWWSNTSRGSWRGRPLPRRFRRFQAWAYDNPLTGERHFWGVDGTHYDTGDFEKIRNDGKNLPPPPP